MAPGFGFVYHAKLFTVEAWNRCEMQDAIRQADLTWTVLVLCNLFNSQEIKTLFPK